MKFTTEGEIMQQPFLHISVLFQNTNRSLIFFPNEPLYSL